MAAGAPPLRVRTRAALALLAALLATAFAGPAAARADAGATAAGPPAPANDAAAAILVVASTGQVAYAEHPDRERQIASTTKLMTALLTLEHERLGHVCTAPAYHAQPAESRINLRAGERLTVRDLLRGLLLPSANDAAATLADCVSGSIPRFVALMNRRARQLGLHHTHYANPIGLDDPRNYSTARDLATLAIYLRAHEPFFDRTTDRPRATLHSGDRPRTVVNRNTLVATVPWVNGVKTGHTDQAGWCLVGSGTRHGVTLVSVVLGEPTEAQPETDTLALLKWGMRRYHRSALLTAGRPLAHPSLRYRPEQHVALVPASSVTRVVARGERPRVVVRAPAVLDGPLRKGARAGTAEVELGRRRIASVPLVTAAPVARAGLLTRALHHLGTVIPIALILLAGIGTLILGLRRRRASAKSRRRPREREVA